MSLAPPPPRKPVRHALGMPAGSIRALLALIVLGTLWLLALRAGPQAGALLNQQASLSFIYLQFLMVLILAHFYAAHGNTIGPHLSERSPLGLPRGSIRFLLLAGYLGLAAYVYSRQLAFEYPPTGAVVLLLLVLLCGFFAGYLLTAVVRLLAGGLLPFWFQDIQAWVALLAACGLITIVVIHTIINTSLPLEKQLDAHLLQSILAGLVGFYFGGRC